MSATQAQTHDHGSAHSTPTAVHAEHEPDTSAHDHAAMHEADTTEHAHDNHDSMPDDHAVHAPQGQDHSQHGQPTNSQEETVDHTMHDMTTTAASEPAVSGMRDPHGYSNGLQRGEGPYLVEGAGLHLADEMRFSGIRMNRMEEVFRAGKDATQYQGQVWFGTSYQQLVVRAQGEFADGHLDESDTELLWSRAYHGFWNTIAGVRHQTSDGPSRSWLAVGLQGISPYWFEVDLTAYLGQSGRTAFTAEASYDLLITQRLILQPRAEMNFYSKTDPAVGIGKGLSDTELGLRLEYQINRHIVPYVGIEQVRLFGDTADMNRHNTKTSQTNWVAGLRFWF